MSPNDCNVKSVLRTADTAGLPKQGTEVVGRAVHYGISRPRASIDPSSDSLHALGFCLGSFARFPSFDDASLIRAPIGLASTRSLT